VHEVANHGRIPPPGKVATNRSRSRGGGIGRARESPESLDHTFTLGDGGDDGAGEHELEKGLEKRLARVLLVMALQRGPIRLTQIEGHQSVGLRFDTAEDLAAQPSGDAIGFDKDEGSLVHRFEGTGEL